MKLERKMREEKNKRFKKTKFSGCVNDTEKGIGNTEKEFEKEKMKCVSGTTITHLSPSKLAKILEVIS